MLLGLSSLVVANETTIDPALYPLLQHESLDIRRVAFYEGILTLSWVTYYTSSIERAAKNISFRLELLDDEVQSVTGVQRDQLDAMRSR